MLFNSHLEAPTGHLTQGSILSFRTGKELSLFRISSVATSLDAHIPLEIQHNMYLLELI